MKNSPRSVLIGWTSLAVCALGGYMVSKAYTNHRLKQYTSGFGSVTSSNANIPDTPAEQKDPNAPFQRSVNRRL
ncbi:uncharacterized protein BYT42DRAFT_609621 [Radiomyces spectabilis]|uniref:uncharacterized protein n=1 Tax=Radiomyces spectabilis TaxID=64574 RepID=UPI00221F24C8|nr:uncharacterized protein BYT42DRAFT_609621 [Radiomyces spectabilis]KAI8393856.1 hypothetical protein BYT42DRAFT_609621 [Radiomyces spectabilis]